MSTPLVTLAQGNGRALVYQAESIFGTVPDTPTGKVIRRVNTALSLSKDVYESNEKRTDFQKVDSRHGLRRIQGNIDGEFYAGHWADFFAALLRRAYTVGETAAITDGITVANNVWTRLAGSFLTDGFQVGMVLRVTNHSQTANNNRNAAVTAVTALTMTLEPLDGEDFTDSGVSDTSVTFTEPGKRTYVPLTGHTTDSFTIEDRKSEIDVSEVYTGCRIGGVSLEVPATGLVTCSWTIMGRDQLLFDGVGAPFFSNPASASVCAERALASVPGYVRFNGQRIAVATGLSLNIDLGLNTPPVIGSNQSPDVFYGRAISVTGQVTLFMTNQNELKAFRDEDEFELHVVMELPVTTPGTPPNFVSVFLPRVKINSATPDDPDGGIVQTVAFEALMQCPTNGYETTTIIVQDSAA